MPRAIRRVAKAETGKNSSLKPEDGRLLSSHLDFRFLFFRNVKEYENGFIFL
jgi:hypothetical protein